MKTICIKTNNIKAIDYLLNTLENIELNDVYFSCHKFNIYNNIFIHYTGNNLEIFLSTISNLLVFLVLDVFEQIVTKKILQDEYFYFDTIERKQILDKINDINLEDIEHFTIKENILFNAFYNFLKDNDKLYLKGFLTFRIKDYFDELKRITDDAVNRYLIEREYSEFVSLLKLYINSEESKIDLVHLIYHDEDSVLLDQNKNIIKTDINLLNAKFLSDITFSSSDIVLNTLLNIIPKKIYIHLENNNEDEFITTLRLIFEDRVSIINNK